MRRKSPDLERLHYYYLVYFPPKEALQREKIVKGLASLGGLRLHSSLWKIPSERIKNALKAVSGNDPVVLKRSREILPPNISFDKNIFDLGSVAVISYRLPKTSSRKRTAVQRMLRRAPKIKISPALFMIPYLKSSKLNAYKGRAVLQDEMFEFLDSEGVENNRLTYLKIVYPSSHERLLELMVSYENLVCTKLTSTIRSLIHAANHAELDDIVKFQKLLSFYKSRYRDLQGVAYFMNDSMNVDLRPSLKMLYNALVHYKRAVERKSEKLNVTELI